MSLKILIISQYFYPESFRINELALDLKKNGHQITVLTGIPNYPDGSYFKGYGVFKKRRENYHGVEVIRVPLVPRRKGKKINLILNYFSFAFFATLLAPFFCRGKFDVIFVFEPSPITVGLPALLLKKIKRIPIFFWVQDLWPESLSATGAVRSERILSWVRGLARFIYKRCDRILVQSQAFIPSIEQMGIPRSVITYFPNAAENIFNLGLDSNQTAELKLPDGFKVIFAGNIGVSQSFETLLEAALMLKEHPIHWVIIGDGRQKTWLVEQVNIHGLSDRIHLIERKPVEEIPLYLNLADVLLVSLKRDPVFALTIPSKLQSYLACGKPIIASLDGEAARIVEESGAGLASAAEDAKSLADNILAMYNMPLPLRKLMGERGRAYFENHFEKGRLLEQLESWMISTLA